MTAKVESWGSRVGLILAMAGNAVGLGNFFKISSSSSSKWRRSFYYSLFSLFFINGYSIVVD